MMDKNNIINNDIYYNLLCWASNKGFFTIDELLSNFPNEKEMIEKEILYSKIFSSFNYLAEKKYYLTFEDRFKLFQFKALQEARKESETAKYFSLIAIIISVFIGFIQILLAL